MELRARMEMGMAMRVLSGRRRDLLLLHTRTQELKLCRTSSRRCPGNDSPNKPRSHQPRGSDRFSRLRVVPVVLLETI